VEALLRQCYSPGRTFGQAFAAFLQALLADYGLLLIDPMHPAMRALAAPAIRDALTSAPEITQRLLQRDRDLLHQGYHSQVHVEEHTSLVFLLEDGRRVSLRRENGDYVSSGRRFSTQELRDRAEHLSPNALLRPVVQDFMLPTVAYVGGPAELAYLAQSEVIYQQVLGRQPVALHRSGFTVVDQRSRKLMQRAGLCLQDFFHGEEPLRQKLAAGLVAPGIAELMRETKLKTVQSLENLTGQLNRFDPTLSKALDKSRRKIEYQLTKIERKVAHQAFQRDARASHDAAYLYGLIFPQKHLQERLYSIVPLIAKHGPGLVAELYDNVHLDCPDHQLLVA
jgi:bacillithiol synthase